MGSNSDCDDYESLATLVGSRDCTIRQAERHVTNTGTRICRGRGQPPSATRRC